MRMKIVFEIELSDVDSLDAARTQCESVASTYFVPDQFIGFHVDIEDEETGEPVEYEYTEKRELIQL